MKKNSKKIILIIICFLFLPARLLDAKGKKESNFYLQKAHEFEKKEDNKSALAHYSRALNDNPSREDQKLIWFHIGTIYEKSKEYERAIIAYKKVISLGKDNWQGYFNLGNVYQTVGLDDLAISSYENVVKLKPEIFQVWFNLGEIYQKKHFYKRALKYYERAQSINKSNVEICLELVNIYEKLGKLDIAVSYLQSVIDIYPRDEYINRLGLLFLSRGMLDEAVTAFRKIIDKNSANQEAHLNLGYIYFKKSLKKDSIKEFTKAIDISHDNALAYFLRGLVYYEYSDYSLAKQDFILAGRKAKGEMLKLYSNKMVDKLNKVTD